MCRRAVTCLVPASPPGDRRGARLTVPVDPGEDEGALDRTQQRPALASTSGTPVSVRRSRIVACDSP
jgi:hypothetical protein